jgi:inosose dehydratase
MNIQIGTAPDSWGVWFADDPRQTPWHRYLDEVVEAGYDRIELGPSGYLPTDPRTLQREIEARGLKVSASFVMHDLEDASIFPTIRDHTERMADLLASLGAKYLVLIDEVYRDLLTGEQRRPVTLDEDSWKRLVDTANRMGRRVKEDFGLQLTFHPHADSHVERQHQIERFIADTDPDVVGICLDFGHCEYKGADSIGLLRSYHERIPYLHLKAVDPQVRDRVEAENVPFGTAVAWGIFTELGEGIPTLEDLMTVLRDVDYSGWATVEQDLYPCDFDKPLPIAKRTRARLAAAGLG